MCNKSAVPFICFSFLINPAICLQNGPQKDTYGVAKIQCSKLGTGYKLSNPFFGSRSLDFQKWEGFDFWLPYTRVVYDNYSWVDSTPADTKLNSLGHRLGYSCGAIDLQNIHYDFQPCHLGGSSFICQIKGCSTCSSIDQRQFNCVVLRNECFTYHCGSGNWYKARETCKQQGGDLAVVKDVPDIAKFLTFYEPAHGSSCNTPYIGLNREQWKAEDGGESTFSILGEEEPSPFQTCSVISVKNLCFTWRAVSCHEKYWYYCGKDVTAATSSEKPDADKSIPEVTNWTKDIISTKLLVVIMIFSMFLAIILQIVILTRKKKANAWRKAMSGNQQAEDEAGEFLLHDKNTEEQTF